MNVRHVISATSVMHALVLSEPNHMSLSAQGSSLCCMSVQ
jgi:hypothetical protein